MLMTILYSLLLLFPLVLSNSISLKNPLYIITNAERPSFDRPGLSPIGLERASECIPSVFANLNITFGVIVVCTPTSDSLGCTAANTTAAPIAANLGLVPDTSCNTGDESDDACAPNLLTNYSKNLNKNESMLVVWDAHDMENLLEHLELELDDAASAELSDDDLSTYADIILIKPVSTDRTVSATSMNCTGIDGQAPGTF